jgi:hypothetical protein
VEITVQPSGDRKKTNPSFAFKKGDTVRISHVRQPFDREYDEHWTVEYFLVAIRGVKEGLPYYTLKDTTGEVVQGTFFPIGAERCTRSKKFYDEGETRRW